jgi:hypothetical protein
MTDLAQGPAATPCTAIPSPASIRPRPVAAAEPVAAASDSGRAAARAALETALSGVELTGFDRRFLARLSQWDKRSASTAASLMLRARRRGRTEAGLSGRQLETMLAALADAFDYRTSRAAATGCWDCANWSSDLCPDHAQDADRAREFADLATALAGQVMTGQALTGQALTGQVVTGQVVTGQVVTGQVAPTSMPRLGAVPDFRQRTPVAS